MDKKNELIKSNNLDFLSDLSEEQIKAVEYIEGPSIISAVAGSGKTRVLTYKIAYLIKKNYLPCSILALTFTNQAADEMKERITYLVNSFAADKLWMGTFHAIFLRILRNNSDYLIDKYGFKENFTLILNDDKNNLLNSIIEKFKMDFQNENELDIHKNDTYDKLYKISNVISKIKNEGVNLNDNFIKRSIKINEKNIPILKKIYEEYVNKCRDLNVMDFDDILVYTYDMLKNSENILLKYQNRFKFILIDEYQDTNKIQFMIISLLSLKHKKICVVGDDAQCIYSFRGSRIENIKEFTTKFEAKQFNLQKNYRSTKNIIECANDLIKKNEDQIKILSANNLNQYQSKVKIIECKDEEDEAKKVVNEIQKLKITNEKYSWNSFAILYRAHTLSESFERHLNNYNIPYKKIKKSKLGTEIIAHIFAYLKVIVNLNDNISFLKIINYSFKENQLKLKLDTDDKNNISYWNAAIEYIEENKNENENVEKLNQIIQLIISFKCRYKSLKLVDTIDEIANFIKTILKKYNSKKDKESIIKLKSVASDFSKKYDDPIKLENNEKYENKTEINIINEFINEIFLKTFDENAEIFDDDEKNSKVKLMTIHCSKGLEFDNVFIVGVENGFYPLYNYNKTDNISEMKHNEEEKRTFYVALTRAKENCFITYAKKRIMGGNNISNEKSPYIKDLEEKPYVEYIWIDSEDDKNNNKKNNKFLSRKRLYFT